MGNPLRFYGTGNDELIDDIVVPGRCTVEVTFRTLHQQFLFRPDPETTEIIKGCFGRALNRYPSLEMHVIYALSNHGGFLVTPPYASMLSDFMRDFLSTTAHRLNDRFGREGTFFERRYRSIPIVDADKLEERFCYVLTQSTKENLLGNAADWPGFSSARALLGGPALVGRWRDGSSECELRRQLKRKRERAAERGAPLPADEIEPQYIEYPIALAPLPTWKHLRPGQCRSRVAAILRDDAEKTRARHARDGTRPLGVAALIRQDPFSRPRESNKSPAPRCHASSRKARKAFKTLYCAYVESYRDSAARLKKDAVRAGFVRGTFTPSLRVGVSEAQSGTSTNAPATAATPATPETSVAPPFA